MRLAHWLLTELGLTEREAVRAAAKAPLTGSRAEFRMQ
jgi:hypothetical protein